MHLNISSQNSKSAAASRHSSLGKCKLFFALLFASAVLSFSPVLAAENGAFLKVAPLYFDLQIDPGQEKSGRIYIENLAAGEQEITVEISDFFIDTAGNYIFTEDKNVTNEELKPYLMRDWIESDIGSLKLAPGEGKNVSYQIQVPGDASLGGHYGAIFFKTKCVLVQDEHVISTDKSSLCVSGRVGALFLVQVGGEAIKSGEISKIKIPRITFNGEADAKLEMTNTGNTHFRPSGNLEITGMINQEKQIVEIGNKILFPKQKYEFLSKIKGNDILGYKIAGSIKDGEGRVVSFKKYVFMPQWEKMVVLILIIIILIYFFKKYRFHKKNIRIISIK